MCKLDARTNAARRDFIRRPLCPAPAGPSPVPEARLQCRQVFWGVEDQEGPTSDPEEIAAHGGTGAAVRGTRGIVEGSRSEGQGPRRAGSEESRVRGTDLIRHAPH
jgi:hypothetical protein